MYMIKFLENDKAMAVKMDKQVRKKIHEINDQQVVKKIIQIIGRMKCPKDFKCAKHGFEKLCLAKDCGMDDYLECFDDDPLPCKFVLKFGDQFFCQCPLRVYIAKNLEK